MKAFTNTKLKKAIKNGDVGMWEFETSTLKMSTYNFAVVLGRFPVSVQATCTSGKTARTNVQLEK